MSTFRTFHRLLTTLILVAVLGSIALGAAPARAIGPATDRIDPVLLEKMLTDRGRLLPIIVEMEPARAPFAPGVNLTLATQALDLIRRHGRPIGTLPLIDAAAGFADAAGIEAISLSPGVAYVHEDSTVRPRLGPDDRQTDASPAYYPEIVRAPEVWAQNMPGHGSRERSTRANSNGLQNGQHGPTGRGVAVAVLDSGIYPAEDLTRPTNRILAAVNLAGDRGPLPDPGGHGTHVAGIIAGNGGRSRGEYIGIAPNANVIDIRVLDQHGNGRISSVVRGIGWVLANRERYNIRVINLSLGAPARRHYRADPLSAAVEIAWRRGLVVVAAAGNGGPRAGTVDSPGIDPYAITVGATDDRATLATGDDVLAWFSSWGTPPGSTPKPDLVAPGRRIVSLRAPGSTLDRLYADRIVRTRNGATYFRLTGTSMSTPIVSGIVALMLEHRPNLTPDQVKNLLTGSARPYGAGSPPDPSADGAGLVDAFAAVNGSPREPVKQSHRPADTLARTLYPVIHGQALAWQDPAYQGINWSVYTWDTLPWTRAAWDNLDWSRIEWTDAYWDDAYWDDAYWDDAYWDDAYWDDAYWDDAYWDKTTLD